VHDVNIYTKSVAKSVVSWGEMHIFAYLKNLNSHEMLKNQWKGKISTSEHQTKHFCTTNQHFFYSKTRFPEVVLKHLIISNVKFCDINFGEEHGLYFIN
jgi:hypothetical protein